MTKYLLVKGIAGLGARIPAALTALLYAQLSGRTLVIDWTDPLYSDDGSNSFPRFFTHPQAPSAIPQFESVTPASWRGRLGETVASVIADHRSPRVRVTWRATAADFSRLDHDEEVMVWWAYAQQFGRLRPHFTGALAPLRELSGKQILRQFLREELTLHPSIRQRVEEFRARHFQRPTVGVHVRYTDKRVRLIAICKAVEEMLRRERDLQVFLATDNGTVETIFRESFPCVVSLPKTFPRRGTPLHHDRRSGNKMAHAIEALTELYLLAACPRLIGDRNSTFYDVACLLSDATEIRDMVRRRFQVPLLVRSRLWQVRRYFGVAAFEIAVAREWMRLRAFRKRIAGRA